MTCRFDREAEDYLIDGEPCRHDNYGEPTNHCTARRTCSQHVGPRDLTCARCLGRTRLDLRRIPELATLMLPVAIGEGVESDAANLAAPGTNPETWSERRIAMRSHLAAWFAHEKITERQYLHARATMEDDDELHPYNVLGRWDMMLREDYGQPSEQRVTVTNAAAYLERTLGQLAQDPEQDFPLFAREIRKVRSHLENVLRTAKAPERGAPCPECTSDETGVGPRLIREYGHWCEDEDCERFHYSILLDGMTGELVPDTAGDWWECPRDKRHQWDHATYTKWIQERKATRAS